MPLGTEVGLSPGDHVVLDGTQSPPPKKGRQITCPQFSANFYCGHMAGCIKMPFGTEVGLGPDDIVLDRDSAPLLEKGAESPQFLAHVCCRQTAG